MNQRRIVFTLVSVALCSLVSACTNALAEVAESDGPVTILAAGDVEWSRRVRAPEYYAGSEDIGSIFRDDGWRRLPFVASEESRSFIESEYGRAPETAESHHLTALQFGLEFDDERERDRYPFAKVADTLRAADIAFLNLETPLSENGRLSGAFRTPPAFAKALSWAGVDLVSTANNHAFDAEGEGILDTITALTQAHVRHVGTGRNLAEATTPEIFNVKGVRVAFLAYTYGVNPTVTPLGFATEARSGAAPLDPFLIRENIEQARGDADIVILSLHWGLENETEIHPAAIEFAHDLIDAGADVIIGHHPHVPRGVEAYGDGLIVYSLGNFIFGHNHDYWADNFIVEMTVGKTGLLSAQIRPVAGSGQSLFQPYLLEGQNALSVLELIQERSAVLGTEVKIVGNAGIISLNKPE